MAVNVSENANRFKAAISRARKLTQMDANGSLDSYKQNALNEGKMSFNENGVDVQLTPSHETTNYNYVSESKISKSKLPKAVLESMKKNPINTDMLGVDTGAASVLDSFIPKQTIQEERKPHQRIVEQAQPTTIASNVDYSLIKTIVEDCVKKYTSTLKKSLVNENKSLITESNSENTMQAMKIGNKFTFIDAKGNLYEAKLKKVGNINDK